MIDLDNLADRKTLRRACALFGKPKAVADRLGLHHSNLYRWFRGEKTLSSVDEGKLLVYLGVPHGIPDKSKVHEWSLSGHPRNLQSAFGLYFPNGAQLGLGADVWPWRGAKENDLNQIEIAAITDGEVRAIVRMPYGFQPDHRIWPILRWRGKPHPIRRLDMEKGNELWEKGPLSIAAFDLVWGEMPGEERSMADVEKAIDEEGLTFGEAIKRIQGG